MKKLLPGLILIILAVNLIAGVVILSSQPVSGSLDLSYDFKAHTGPIYSEEVERVSVRHNLGYTPLIQANINDGNYNYALNSSEHVVQDMERIQRIDYSAYADSEYLHFSARHIYQTIGVDTSPVKRDVRIVYKLSR
jgi:hypothetical protein